MKFSLIFSFCLILASCTNQKAETISDELDVTSLIQAKIKSLKSFQVKKYSVLDTLKSESILADSDLQEELKPFLAINLKSPAIKAYLVKTVQDSSTFKVYDYRISNPKYPFKYLRISLNKENELVDFYAEKRINNTLFNQNTDYLIQGNEFVISGYRTIYSGKKHYYKGKWVFE